MSEWVSEWVRERESIDAQRCEITRRPLSRTAGSLLHTVTGLMDRSQLPQRLTSTHEHIQAWLHDHAHTHKHKVKGGGGRLVLSRRGSEGRGYIFINMPFSLQQHKVLQWLTVLCIHYADFTIALYIKMWDILVLLCSVFSAVKGKMCVLCAD